MQGVLLLISAGVLAVVALLWFSQYHQTNPQRLNIPHYRRRERLLNPRERAYFDMLRKAVGQHTEVLPKVRLTELVDHPGPDPRFRLHWMRVQRRQVDFLLCSPSSLAPVLAIKFETRADRKRREVQGPDVLDETLEIAEIPLLRVKAEVDYDLVDVAQQVRFALSRAHRTATGMYEEERPAERVPLHQTFQRFVFTQLPTFSRWTSELWVAARSLRRA